MKKELLISIIVGFCLGLLITFGIYNFNKKTNDNVSFLSPLVENEKSQEPPKKISQTLTLVSPFDQSISSEAKTVVSGITSPLSWVIILAEKGEKTIRADEKGNFETQINLISGENEIQINAILESGQVLTRSVTVVYSTAEI